MSPRFQAVQRGTKRRPAGSKLLSGLGRAYFARVDGAVGTWISQTLAAWRQPARGSAGTKPGKTATTPTAAATKGPPKKVPPTKAASTKAPVKKAPVKKAPVKKAPRPPVKKAPTKKAPVDPAQG